MFRAGRALPYWALEGVTVARHILDSLSAHIISHARQKGRCEDACPARLPAAARRRHEHARAYALLSEFHRNSVGTDTGVTV